MSRNVGDTIGFVFAGGLLVLNNSFYKNMIAMKMLIKLP